MYFVSPINTELDEHRCAAPIKPSRTIEIQEVHGGVYRPLLMSVIQNVHNVCWFRVVSCNISDVPWSELLYICLSVPHTTCCRCSKLIYKLNFCICPDVVLFSLNAVCKYNYIVAIMANIIQVSASTSWISAVHNGFKGAAYLCSCSVLMGDVTWIWLFARDKIIHNSVYIYIVYI